MAVTNWWTVDDAQQLITGGPFLWDGAIPWTPINGQRAVNSDPVSGLGYSWIPASPVPAVELINARLAALENRLFNEARGVVNWPAIGVLALNGTNTQRCKLKTPMPNINFTPTAFVLGSAVLGNLAVSAVAVVDKQNVDVTIKASVAVTITLGSVAAIVFADAN